MPFIRCKWYNDDGSAADSSGRGCTRQQQGVCDFIHPSSSDWDRAPPPRQRYEARGRGGGGGRGGRGRGDGPRDSSSDRDCGGSFVRRTSDARHPAPTSSPNDYRDTSTWVDSSHGFPEASSSPNAQDKGTQPARQFTMSDWEKTAQDDGWGNTSKSNGWGNTEKNEGWGNVGQKDKQGNEGGNERREQGSTTAADWENASSWGASAGGGWGDLSDLGGGNASAKPTKESGGDKHAPSGANSGWGGASTNVSGPSTAADGHGESRDKGKARATPPVDQESNSRSAWNTAPPVMTNREAESSWGAPPALPLHRERRPSSTQWGNSATPSGWGQGSPQSARSRSSSFTRPNDDATTPTATKPPVAQGWGSASFHPSSAHKPDLPSRQPTVEHIPESPMDIDTTSHASMDFARSGSVMSSGSANTTHKSKESESNDPHKLMERLIRVQQEIAVAERYAEEQKDLSRNTYYGHVGHRARITLDSLFEHSSKKLYDLKQKEVEYLDALAKAPSLVAQAKAVEEERRQVEKYLADVTIWLEASEPAVAQAVAARQAQLAQERARPSKRVRLEAGPVYDIDEDDLKRLKADMSNLSEGINPYKALHIGFAGAEKRLEDLERWIARLTEAEEKGPRMDVDKEAEGQISSADIADGKASLPSLHKTASTALDHLDGTVAEMEKLVLTMQKDGLEAEMVRLHQETAVAKTKTHQLLQSYDAAAMQTQVDALQSGVQEVQTKYRTLQEPSIPQETVDHVASVMVNIASHRLQDYFQKLDEITDSNLEKARQDFLAAATDRLAPIVHLVTECEGYLKGTNPVET